MIVSIEILIPVDKRICEALRKALEPDNRGVPSGIEIAMRCSDDGFFCVVLCRDAPILTCRNTVDDILEHASTALKLVSEIDHVFKSSHIP